MLTVELQILHIAYRSAGVAAFANLLTCYKPQNRKVTDLNWFSLWVSISTSRSNLQFPRRLIYPPPAPTNKKNRSTRCSLRLYKLTFPSLLSQWARLEVTHGAGRCLLVHPLRLLLHTYGVKNIHASMVMLETCGKTHFPPPAPVSVLLFYYILLPHVHKVTAQQSVSISCEVISLCFLSVCSWRRYKTKCVQTSKRANMRGGRGVRADAAFDVKLVFRG